MATILIVDTNPADRRSYITLLGNFGHRFVEADDGAQALALARTELPDLIITDILMLELNGLDMLLELTREFLHAKVIAITGAGEEQNVLDVAKLLGARQTFQKPFSMPQLLDAVRYELEH